MDTPEKIKQRLASIEAYIEQYGYPSYDIFDGLNGHWVRNLSGTNSGLQRIWLQFIRYSPVNIRPILGIKKIIHTKVISDFLSAYSILYRVNGGENYRHKIMELTDLLHSLSLPTQYGMGWGLRFPVATRFTIADENTCNSFNTINAIHTFLDAYETLGCPEMLSYANQGMIFEEKEMGYSDLGKIIRWNYWKGLESEIYNVNGLMLGLTARMYQITGQQQYREWAIKLLEGIREGQNPNGSWYYSADEKGKWIDGFHTGYILEGLSRACFAGIIPPDDKNLKMGVDFYIREMFQRNGLPLYYPGKSAPIDVQNCAQAIQTLIFLKKLNICTNEQVNATFERIDNHLWNRRGYYNVQKRALVTYRTPMHRWGTGPMFLALSYALSALKE
jgi:hypothetical protein